jgi:hypothetical protein
VVNGCLWAAGLEDKIPEKTDVTLVGEYKPTRFKFKGPKDWAPLTPADLLK